MEEKLRRLMKHEGINSTRLAEIMGIQASGISHIMSGRNKPSFDFLLKLLQRFPQINPDWLILDKGHMYRDEIKNKPMTGSLPVNHPNSVSASSKGFPGYIERSVNSGNTESDINDNTIENYSSAAKNNLFGPDNDDIIPSNSAQSATIPNNSRRTMTPEESKSIEDFTHSAPVERIVVFYKDKTFSDYLPE